MCVEVVKIKRDVVSREQSLLPNQSSGGWVQVESIGECDDQIRERNVQSVAWEVSMVRQGVDHGARASAWIHVNH